MANGLSQQTNYDELQKNNAALVQTNLVLQEEVDTLKRQVAWFQKQIFGSKSERRLLEDNLKQMPLTGMLGEAPKSEPVDKQTITYQRGKAKKKRADDCVTDSGLRFNADVPVEVIEVQVPELNGAQADQYEVIGTKITHRLGQLPASYVVLQYEQPVVKHRSTGKLTTAVAPGGVFDQSIADVSLLAGLLVDKFSYHLPLYRQHQRIQQAGVMLSRATLTNLVKRSIDLLRPIVLAQLKHLLQSKVLAMDETPIKAGRAGKGKMHTGWFWPLYGEEDEIVFTYSSSRAQQHIDMTLKDHFEGTLLSDGYAASASYAKRTQGVTHAQCWTHTRRQFVEAETVEPDAVATALDYMGEMYQVEKQIKQQQLSGDKKRDYRVKHSKPTVDTFFQWCQSQCQRSDLLPDNDFLKAVNYALTRTSELKVFLEDPDVPIDTNHLESALRPIPMGRRNWLFAWTELGAEHVGIIQSLICTCKLHKVDPYTYLVDVLQRINRHPAKDVDQLTPRLWKERFAGFPLRSALYQCVNIDK